MKQFLQSLKYCKSFELNLLQSSSPINSNGYIRIVALWCSGSMLASHARGPGFNPRAG